MLKFQSKNFISWSNLVFLVDYWNFNNLLNFSVLEHEGARDSLVVNVGNGGSASVVEFDGSVVTLNNSIASMDSLDIDPAYLLVTSVLQASLFSED